MSKKLVAYFSASGVTKALAHRLAEGTDSDIFEILPEVAYTDADLDWRNPNSRSSLEMKDKKSRPNIAGMPEDLSQYDTIYVGFPIWWYTAPTIINTFLEAAGDLNGKTIIPFATSGSSGMGSASNDLEISAPDAIILPGRRFPADTTAEQLKVWAESLQ